MSGMTEQEKVLYEYAGDDKIIKSSEMQELIKTTSATDFTIDTQYPALDGYVEGFEPGELVVISGKTGSGKTLLMQTLTRNIANQGYGVCWFSYEMTPKQFIRCFPELPFFYMPGHLISANVKWLKERCWEAVLKYDTKVIMIDHMHYLFSMAGVHNTSLTLGDIARTLKEMAKYLNIVIVIVCHTTKMEEGRRPHKSDIRDSGMIEREADTILMIWRTQDDGEHVNEATIELAKARRTGEYPRLLKVKKIYPKEDSYVGWLEQLDTQREEV